MEHIQLEQHSMLHPPNQGQCQAPHESVINTASPAITKKPIDLGTVGTAVTLGASLSGDVRTIIGNVTELIGINPVWLLLAIGLGFAAWTVYKRVSEK